MVKGTTSTQYRLCNATLLFVLTGRLTQHLHYLADGLFSDRSDVNVVGMGETVTLPDPELSNLAEIESAIKEAQGGMNEKEKLASFIVAEVGTL